MKRVLGLVLMVAAMSVQAQYKCSSAGKTVIQEEPCNSPGAGRSRCFIDGEVIYIDGVCSSVKNKAQREEAEKQAEEAANRAKMAAAKKLEAADQPNFSRRIAIAQDNVARHLKDPTSAKFGNVWVSWYSGAAVVCGVVSGKNGFGGYADPVRFFAEDQFVEIDGARMASNFDARWASRCPR